MRKIALISDARTSHGIYRPILDELMKRPGMKPMYILTGLHLLDKFGRTIEQVKKDGYAVAYTIKTLDEEGEEFDQVIAIGKAIEGLVKIFTKDRPDIILAQADRGIALAAAVVGDHMKIPVAHLHGGEISGTVDEDTRHAVTKYSHIHFPATKKSAERIRKLGEEEWRIHLVGASAVGYIVNAKFKSKQEVCEELGLDSNKETIVVLQHPITEEADQAGEQMRITLKALENEKQIVVIYPNADRSYSAMIKEIDKFSEEHKDTVKKYPSLPFQTYLGLLRFATALVGNSSGAIMEGPSLGVPVINVGNRQRNREIGKNVINATEDVEDIRKALKRIREDKEYQTIVAKRESPYDPHGDGRIAERIVDVLENIEINDKLLLKQIIY